MSQPLIYGLHAGIYRHSALCSVGLYCVVLALGASWALQGYFHAVCDDFGNLVRVEKQ